MSGLKRSWFQIIQDHVKTTPGIQTAINVPFTIHNSLWNEPKTDEQKYYRKLFNRYYKHYSTVIPYFWMPKFIEATDSSARTLKIYDIK